MGDGLSSPGTKGSCPCEGLGWDGEDRPSAMASATAAETSVLKVEITQQGTCTKMLSPCFVPLLARE